ncbi:MAG: hypothetical protein QM765_50275 [Myxococcales bacterium]
MPTLYLVEDAALVADRLGESLAPLPFQVVLCDRARLDVVDSSLRFQDVWASGESTVALSGSTLAATVHLQQRSSLSGKASRLDAVSFETCSDLTLDGLPDTVDPTGLPAPLSAAVKPPRASASVDLQAVRLGAWRVRWVEGSALSIRNAGERANLEVTLEFGGEGRSYELRATQGLNPSVTGFASGSLTFQDAAVSKLHLAPAPGTSVRLLAGSRLADCSPPPGGSITAEDSTLVGGSARVAPGARLHLVRSSLEEPLENKGPFLCQRCELRSSLTTRSTVWLADTRLGHLTKDARWPGSQFYEVSLMSPQDGTRASGEVVVKGTLTANGVMTEKLIPFPPVKLDLVRRDSGQRHTLATFDNVRHYEELARFDAASFEPGAYELQLHFDSELGAQAPATRSLVIEKKKPSACAGGCSQPGQAPGWLALVFTAGLLRRRLAAR